MARESSAGILREFNRENTAEDRLSTVHNSAARAISSHFSTAKLRSFLYFSRFPPCRRSPRRGELRISQGGDKESLSKQENEAVNGGGQCRGVRPQDTVDCPP